MLTDSLLDLLFPRQSLGGDTGAWITEAELAQLQIDPVIETTGQLRARGISALDRITAAVPYHQAPLIQQTIWLCKYRRVPELAKTLGDLIVEAVQWCDAAKLLSFDYAQDDSLILCPVPLHWSRRFQRGFNQAELIARQVRSTFNLPVQPLLRRSRSTGHQAWRGRAERLQAVQGAFRVRRNQSLPNRVILIDDLATTGATLDACAVALKEAGVQWVEGWVVAHG